MNDLQNWYPFFWALLAVLALFLCILLEILANEFDAKATKKRLRQLDRAHFLVMQNRGAM